MPIFGLPDTRLSFVTVLKFEEADHPRDPKGVSSGGKFTSKPKSGTTTAKVKGKAKVTGKLAPVKTAEGKKILLSKDQMPRAEEAHAFTRAMAQTAMEIGSPGKKVKAQKPGKVSLNTAVTHAARIAIKQQVTEALTTRLIDKLPDHTPASVKTFVEDTIMGWASTSGDHDPRASQRQAAVQEEFGLTDAPLDHLKVVKPDAEYAQDRAYARAEYEATQEWFKAQGITHVSLYRGVGRKELDPDVDPADVSPRPRTVLTQPATSWTTSIETAYMFGYSGSMLATRVPVERILSIPVAGRGTVFESEVIAMGGKMDVIEVPYGAEGGTPKNEKRVAKAMEAVWAS